MNLLLSMADQLRFDALSPVTPALHTPGFAALAREGVLFSRAYSSTPTCAPARAALLTGRSPWGHGLLGVGPIALSYPWEFPRTLASVGYQAAVVGKNNFGWNLSAGLEGGREHSHSYQSWQIYDGKTGQHDQYREYFAEQVGYRRDMANGSTPANVCWPTLDMNSWRGAAFACDEELHPTAWAGRKAVAFLRAHRDAGRLGRPPFLLKLSFHRPHSPYDPPQRLLDAVQYDAIPPPARSVDGWSAHFATCDQRGTAHKPFPDSWCGEMPAEEERLARRAYHASVRFVDEQISAVHEVLRTTGLLERTLWLFLSDHGDGQGDHFHWRKGYPYEFSAHIPMLLRWPEAWPPSLPPVRIPRGSTLDAVVELRDVAPTLVHAAGILPEAIGPAGIEGSSLLCLLSGNSTDAPPVSGGGWCAAAWRASLTLEHSTCNHKSNHWS